MTGFYAELAEYYDAIYSTARRRQSILRTHFLMARKGRGVRYVTATERSGLFDHPNTFRFLRNSGLRARFLRRGLMPGRGVFVAIRPTASRRRDRRRRA